VSRFATVVGGSGFVGSAVVGALRDAGLDVEAVPAPRLYSFARTADEVVCELHGAEESVAALAIAVGGADIVVNAAGVANAKGDASRLLLGANAMLPLVVREAARRVTASRFVHISSAGVQGRRDPLDESSSVAPFSPYTRSKALGEQVLAGLEATTVFRPTSVHGRHRSVTQTLAMVARSPAASVAGGGDCPSPQVLVENVASAIAFVATHEGEVPPIVMQPWEGLTTLDVMEILGCRNVRHVPVGVAESILSAMRKVAGRSAKVSVMSRRLEMLWFGQRQIEGWLTTTSWRPPIGRAGWAELSEAMTREKSDDATT